jgi:transposase, IS5 family
VPDETTILNFRHLLEQHELTAQVFAVVQGLLKTKGLLLKHGTTVDATIISAPTSTKNAPKQLDPEMQQTRKGREWFFGMKVHVGTDSRGIAGF